MNKKVRHVLGISGGKDSAALAMYMKMNYLDIYNGFLPSSMARWWTQVSRWSKVRKERVKTEARSS